jgi:hypothetical protein
MPLQRGVKRFEMERFIECLGGAEGESTIHKRAVQKGGGYDHGYVSRQWIRFQPRQRFISINDGHGEIHEDQIGTGRACLI